MTREEFYKLTNILNSEVLGNFMHGGEADELIAMFEEAVEHSNILEQEELVSVDLEDAASSFARKDSKEISNPANFYYTVADKARIFKAGAEWQKEKIMRSVIASQECKYVRVFHRLIGGSWNLTCPTDKLGLSSDDRLKVYIIKED